MIKGLWMAFLTICLLWSSTGFADDVRPSDADIELRAIGILSARTMLPESAYPFHWQPFQSHDALAFSENWRRPVVDFEIRDTSALSRVSKLHRLSLLTLAEFGHSELFLGINQEGLLGLHFGVFPHDGGERYLEMVRMPYLKKINDATE